MYSDDEDSTMGPHAPKGTFEIYRAEGESLFRNGLFKKAITSMTMALDQKPGHKECLILRSSCHLELGELNQALKDAETTIKDSKKYYKGLYQKAEVLYAQGEFEQALVFYHRCHNLRPEIQDFRRGIQKAEEAIDNSVGDPGKVKLTKEGDLSYFEDQRIKSTSSARGSGRTPRKSQQRPRTRQGEQEMKRLLGDLYGDKRYLEELLKEAASSSKSNEDISGIAKEGVDYLEKRADFWRQQLPPASKDAQKGKKGSRSGQSSAQSTALAEKDPGRYVIKQLDLIDKEQAEGKFIESIKRCKRCMEKVNGYPEGTLQNRADIIGSLHSYLGNAYLELADHDNALKHYQLDHEIATQQDNPESLARSLANMGRIHSRQANYQKAIDSWTEALKLCENNVVDVMWLNHEIGRCHLELQDYDDAKRCGEQSLDAAREGDDAMWQINALVLLAQSSVKLGEYAESVTAFEEALELAKEQNDKPAVDAITKAIKDVNAKILNAESKDEEVEDSDEGSQEGEYQISATPQPETQTEETPQETGPPADDPKQPADEPKQPSEDPVAPDEDTKPST